MEGEEKALESWSEKKEGAINFITYLYSLGLVCHNKTGEKLGARL